MNDIKLKIIRYDCTIYNSTVVCPLNLKLSYKTEINFSPGSGS